MGDSLAKKLFHAFWDPLVARGWPLPETWDKLHETQRAAWQAVATQARAILGGEIREHAAGYIGEDTIAVLLEAAKVVETE